jgi:hypothetical protein
VWWSVSPCGVCSCWRWSYCDSRCVGGYMTFLLHSCVSEAPPLGSDRSECGTVSSSRPAERFPQVWRFRRHCRLFSTDNAYVGGECDSYRSDRTILCGDIVHSSPMLCLGGALAVSFNAFLLHLRHKSSSTPAVFDRVRSG